jgi:AcrR family transcriptional regulator
LLDSFAGPGVVDSDASPEFASVALVLGARPVSFESLPPQAARQEAMTRPRANSSANLPDAGLVASDVSTATLVAADQCRRIVVAGGETFSSRGYDGTAVEQIIGLAGVSRRTFYDLFANKEDAFRVAHGEALKDLSDRVALACDVEREWSRGVAAAIAAALAWASVEPRRAQLVAGGPAVAGPLSAYCHDVLVARFAPSLRAGWTTGEAPVSSILEEALLAGIAAIVELRLAGEGAASSLRDLAPQLIELALTPYVGAAEARRIAGEY